MIQDSRFKNEMVKKEDTKIRPRRLFRVSCILNRESPRSGFTIIETMVAIAILLLSITAPLTIAEKGLASAEAAKKEITAFYLAQEAVEYVRNIRDTNALKGDNGKGGDWLKGLSKCTSTANGPVRVCDISITESNEDERIVECNVNNDQDCRLYQNIGDTASPLPPQDPLFGIFGHNTASTWKATDIVRKITITEIQKDVEAEVAVTVSWRAGSLGSRTLTLKENIFNWYTEPK